MTIKEFLAEWTERCKGFKNISKRIEENGLWNEMIEKTKFLNSDSKWNKRCWHIINDINHPIICPYCDKECSFDNSIKKGYYHTCGDIKCYKKQEKKTNLVKYGFESPMSNPEVQAKFKAKHLELYGCTSSIGTKESRVIRSNNYKKKFLSKHPQLLNITEDNKYVGFICEHCNEEKEIERFHYVGRNFLHLCYECKPLSGGPSKHEFEILNWVKEHYEGEIILSYRDKTVKNSQEIDVYFPDIKFGIEFNGSYWHSEEYKSMLYHKNKKELAISKGIDLIFIWDDDWINKETIVKSIILNKIGKVDYLQIENCDIKEITNKDITDFYKNNSLNSIGNTFGYCYGIFYQGNMINALNIRKEKNKLKILFYCNKIGFTIQDKESILLKKLLFIHNSKEISVLINRDSIKDSDYSGIGFQKVKNTSVNRFWLIDNKRNINENRECFKIHDSGNTLFRFKMS